MFLSLQVDFLRDLISKQFAGYQVLSADQLREFKVSLIKFLSKDQIQKEQNLIQMWKGSLDTLKLGFSLSTVQCESDATLTSIGCLMTNTAPCKKMDFLGFLIQNDNAHKGKRLLS